MDVGKNKRIKEHSRKTEKPHCQHLNCLDEM